RERLCYAAPAASDTRAAPAPSGTTRARSRPVSRFPQIATPVVSTLVRRASSSPSERVGCPPFLSARLAGVLPANEPKRAWRCPLVYRGQRGQGERGARAAVRSVHGNRSAVDACSPEAVVDQQPELKRAGTKR